MKLIVQFAKREIHYYETDSNRKEVKQAFQQLRKQFPDIEILAREIK